MNRLRRFIALLVIAAFIAAPAHSLPRRVNTIPIGYQALDVAVNSETGMVYVVGPNPDQLLVIDGATDQIVATVPMPDYSDYVAVNPVTNKIYVSLSFDGMIIEVDGATNQITATINVACASDIDVDPIENRIYSACDRLYIIDGETRAVSTAALPYTDGYAIAVDPVAKRAYVVDYGRGRDWKHRLQIVDLTTNTTLTTLQPGFTETVEVNPRTNRVYLSANFKVSVIDGATNTIVGSVPSGGGESIALNTVTDRLYVTNYGDGLMSIFDASTLEQLGTIPIGYYPWKIAVNTNTHRLYQIEWDLEDLWVMQDDRPPSEPLSLVANALGEDIMLTWEPPAEAGSDPVASYRIYREDERGAFVAIGDVPASRRAFTDLGLCSGTFRYHVTAVNGVGEGPPSLPAQAGASSAKPCPPSALTAGRGPAPRTIALAWDAPASGPTPFAYRVYRGSTAGTATRFVTQVSADTRTATYEAADAEIGRDVFFRVTSVAGIAGLAEQESAYGNAASAKPGLKPYGPPAAPVLTSVTAESGGIRVAWEPASASPDPPTTHYRIWRADSPAGVPLDAMGVAVTGVDGRSPTAGRATILAEVPASNPTVFLDALPCSPNHRYAISAVSAAGESPASNQEGTQWVGTLAACPPRDLVAEPGPTAGSVRLTWTAEAAPATTWRIFYNAGFASGSIDTTADFDGSFHFVHALGPDVTSASISYWVAALRGTTAGARSNEAVAFLHAGSGRAEYLAIGDSIVSGHGLPPYENDACKRSRLAYPVLVMADLASRELVRPWDSNGSLNFACSGATTSGGSASKPDVLTQSRAAAAAIGVLGRPAYVSADGAANNFDFESGRSAEHVFCDSKNGFRDWVNNHLAKIKRDYLGTRHDLTGDSILGNLLDAGNTTVVVQGIYAPIESMSGPLAGKHPLHAAWDLQMEDGCNTWAHPTAFSQTFNFTLSPSQKAMREAAHSDAIKRIKWLVHQANLALQNIVDRANELRPGLGSDRVRFVSPAEWFAGNVRCARGEPSSFVQPWAEFKYDVNGWSAFGGDGHDCVHPSGTDGDSDLDTGVDVLAFLVGHGLRSAGNDARYHVDQSNPPRLV